jgi:hypothetical protein
MTTERLARARRRKRKIFFLSRALAEHFRSIRGVRQRSGIRHSTKVDPMIFSTTAAYGIYPMEACIDQIVESLKNAGCRNEDVCVLLAPTHQVAQVIRNAKVTPKALNSDSPTSELLRWFARLGAVIIPGVAFFVSSRVFLRAVLAPCPATQSSGYADRLIGLGLSQEEADRCAERLRRDGIIIFVCCSGAAKAHWIQEVLRRTGAEEVSCLQEAVGSAYVEGHEDRLQMVS